MKTVCVIQARRGSNRLRDKILMSINKKTILRHVIERALLIQGVDQVVCATVDDTYNQPVLEEARAAGAATFAGSEHDVLDRYYKAAVQYDASIVMRITSDCPLLDPYVCAEAVSLVKDGTADYGATGGTWPHGMDCEVFTFGWLEKAHQQARQPYDREHVTLWMKGHGTIRRQTVEAKNSGLREHNRWVIDYPDDYDFLCKLASLAPSENLPLRWQETLALVDAHPGLRAINKNCAEAWEKENSEIYRLAQEQR